MALGCVGAVRFLRTEGVKLALTTGGGTRALRPVVIARKVSRCSKNPSGAEALAASVSVLRTVTRTGDASTID